MEPKITTKGTQSPHEEKAGNRCKLIMLTMLDGMCLDLSQQW